MPEAELLEAPVFAGVCLEEVVGEEGLGVLEVDFALFLAAIKVAVLGDEADVAGVGRLLGKRGRVAVVDGFGVGLLFQESGQVGPAEHAGDNLDLPLLDARVAQRGVVD